MIRGRKILACKDWSGICPRWFVKRVDFGERKEKKKKGRVVFHTPLYEYFHYRTTLASQTFTHKRREEKGDVCVFYCDPSYAVISRVMAVSDMHPVLILLHTPTLRI